MENTIRFHPIEDYKKAQQTARYLATRAIKAGTLRRKPCRICGSKKSQAHHEDYAKPLEIDWLCIRHHQARHAQLRKLGKYNLHSVFYGALQDKLPNQWIQARIQGQVPFTEYRVILPITGSSFRVFPGYVYPKFP